MSWDLLVAQPGIVARLEATTRTGPEAWCRKVSTARELRDVAEEMQVTPGLYVLYDTFQVLKADEYSATLVHRWFVVLALKNAASQRTTNALDDEAGPLLGKVLGALVGFTPPRCTTPLIPATPPRPFYSPAKFGYYPLAFTHQSYHCTTGD